MIFGKIKDKIILEIWKIKKMINSISKAALEEISLIVILIKLNQSTTTKNKFKKDPATISINKSKSKKKTARVNEKNRGPYSKSGAKSIN